jgi:hypothetical protein
MLTSKHVEFIHQQLGVFGTSWYTMGGAKKMGIAKTPWRTSASNICSFALPAGAVLSGAFPISDPLQPKKTIMSCW